jgi:hypothetical protein
MNATRVMKSVHNTTERLKEDFEAGCSTSRVNQLQLRDTISITRIEGQKIRTDIQRLRDDLMPWVMGRTMTRLSPLGPLTSVCSRAESAELEVELEKTLIEFPSAFRGACENTIHALNFTNKRTHLRSLQTQHDCACSTAFKQTMTRRGKITSLSETRTEHNRTYRCRFKSEKLWRYMLAYQLLPLLQRTLSFTITRTSGAGGCSIGVNLNYSRIVKRVDSELFKLFDSFPGKLRKKKCGTVT